MNPRLANLPPNLAPFLATITWSELGPQLIAETDDGYNVLVGATPATPKTFPSYATDPVILNRQFDSTAAGAYQINHPTYLDIAPHLGITDFSPESQDAIAAEIVRRCGALPWLAAGMFDQAVQACSGRWASLPGNTAGQHLQKLSDLRDVYVKAGGTGS